MSQTDVYAPKPGQLWKTVLNWLTFLFQIFVQIVRGTPSIAQVFSNIGFSYGGQSSFLSPPSTTTTAATTTTNSSSGFKPLPVVEIPLHSSAVDINSAAADDDADVEDSDFASESKLTVCVVLTVYRFRFCF